MQFGERIQQQREAIGLTRAELAARLNVSPSAVSNYEKNISFPKEEVLLRLFDSLETDPNTLLQDSFRGGEAILNAAERRLLRQYRGLSLLGRETVRSVTETLCAYRDEMEELRGIQQEARMIPLYRSPAAAGYVSPLFGEDFDYIPVADGVPLGADFAVRIEGDSMEPLIADGEVVYVNREALKIGDVGIFFVGGDVFCKQYYKDSAGVVYLFSVNRARADADVVLPPSSGQSFACFGRVMVRSVPLPTLG